MSLLARYLLQRRVKRYSILFVLFLGLFMFIARHLTNEEESDNGIYKDDKFPYEDGLLHSSSNSAYTFITDAMNKLTKKKKNSFLSPKGLSYFKDDERILKNWNTSSRVDKCKWLIRGIYADPNWNNRDILIGSDETNDKNKFHLSSERIRIHNYCFMKERIDPVQMFNELNISSTDAYDFQGRMFMFLRNVTSTDEAYIYPIIKNVRNGQVTTKPHTKLSPMQYNSNFMAYWKQESKGRGIALTAAPKDVKLLRSLFKVFEKLGNTYPIQIIQKGGEMSPTMESLIKDYAIETNQNVFIVDLSPVLDPDFATGHIRKFQNKWFASIFNTFEEVMLIDADVVIYTEPESFFNLEGYKNTGLLLWRDREIVDAKTHERCTDMAPYFEPALEEHRLLGTVQKYRLTGPSLETHDEPEAETLYDFFHRRIVTIIDSGVVIYNKKQKLHGLILAEYFHNSKQFAGCVYGDKEYFEFGALVAGEDYHVEAEKAVAIGAVGYHPPREKYYVCSGQMGHVDRNNNLLWSNGGLKNCKSDCAEADFEKMPKYFKAKYGTLKAVKEYYNGLMDIQGFVLPDVQKQKWVQYPDCQQFLYCAFITDPPEPDNKGKLVRFSDEEKMRYNEIGKAWYSGAND
ncbi:Mannosyltransferase putative [Nakaseomyces glabratus]